MLMRVKSDLVAGQKRKGWVITPKMAKLAGSVIEVPTLTTLFWSGDNFYHSHGWNWLPEWLEEVTMKDTKLTDEKRLERMEEDCRILRDKMEANKVKCPDIKIKTLRDVNGGHRFGINSDDRRIGYIKVEYNKVVIKLLNDSDGDWEEGVRGCTPTTHLQYTPKR